jgi:hypothetical protein
MMAALLAANGVSMLGWPAGWYEAVPGVAEHGPFNAHFIRDIGVVFAIAGASFAWTAWRPRAWPAAMAGALFLAIHAFIHLLEAAGGHVSHGTAAMEVPSLAIGAAIAL